MNRAMRTLSRVLLGKNLLTETPPHRERRSIFVRHIDGGSSNIFEAEIGALTNPIYDLHQYGIRFVAPPNQADVLLLTGPLTRNMLAPARAAFEMMPAPRAIITVGDYADFAQRHPPVDPIVRRIAALLTDSYATVDLPDDMLRAIVAHVPGDPPEPRDIIHVLLMLPVRGWRQKPGAS